MEYNHPKDKRDSLQLPQFMDTSVLFFFPASTLSRLPTVIVAGSLHTVDDYERSTCL